MKNCKIFIPSYKRANNLKTCEYLRRIGYDMSDVFVFIDNEADDAHEYEKTCEKYGCRLIVFDIDEARQRYDYIHRASASRRSAGQARNQFQDFAIKNDIDFYCVMDDDTRQFLTFTKRTKLSDNILVSSIFSEVEKMMRKRHIGVFALPQSGDFIGGYKDNIYVRKTMNCTFYLMPYIYRGERGVQDDDTSMFCGILNNGLFTGTAVHTIVLSQVQSATQQGGLTDLYNECKLLNKALVTVIQYPSAIFAEKQIKNGGRLHHRIRYKYLSPCIIKGSRQHDNIAWDTYEEDFPFSNENREFRKF